MKLSFTVPGTPVSWQRNQVGKGKLYRDDKGRKYREFVAWCAKAVKPAGWPKDGPYAVSVVAVYRRIKRPPNWMPPAGLAAWKTGARVVRPTKSGSDVDRISGHILDGMTDAGVYVDDGIPVRLLVEKYWAAEGEKPHVEVMVEHVEWLG